MEELNPKRIQVMHPADAADALQRLDEDEARGYLRALLPADAAAIAAELDPQAASRLLPGLPPRQLGRLL
jgi:flagellar motility protein MotE (MotC chaperone)